MLPEVQGLNTEKMECNCSKKKSLEDQASEYVSEVWAGYSKNAQKIAFKAFIHGKAGYHKSHQLLYVHEDITLPWLITSIDIQEERSQYFIASEGEEVLNEFINWVALKNDPKTIDGAQYLWKEFINTR